MTQTRSHVARTTKVCGACLRRIYPGDPYLIHTKFPNEEFGDPEHFARLFECAVCAHRYNRDHLLREPKEWSTRLIVEIDSMNLEKSKPYLASR